MGLALGSKGMMGGCSASGFIDPSVGETERLGVGVTHFLVKCCGICAILSKKTLDSWARLSGLRERGAERLIRLTTRSQSSAAEDVWAEESQS